MRLLASCTWWTAADERWRVNEVFTGLIDNVRMKGDNFLNDIDR